MIKIFECTEEGAKRWGVLQYYLYSRATVKPYGKCHQDKKKCNIIENKWLHLSHIGSTMCRHTKVPLSLLLWKMTWQRLPCCLPIGSQSHKLCVVCRLPCRSCQINKWIFKYEEAYLSFPFPWCFLIRMVSVWFWMQILVSKHS